MQFGAKVTEENIKEYSSSSNWKNGIFVNLEETGMSIPLKKTPKLIYKQFIEKKGKTPKKPLSIHDFDIQKFNENDSDFKFIWYGHSVLLLKVSGLTILIDPMFGPNAAPISPFPVKRFSENTLDLIDDLPNIDIVLLTHDHYDHLDYQSIQKLIPKVKHYYTAIGVGRHLLKWGINREQITEFDWWDNKIIDSLNITFTPTRHFSGRGLKDRAKSLWGGWALKSETKNIWFSGDGGYGNHFKEVGDKLGPFDFGFMECGQYNENWHQIHMFPKESIQAAIDAKVNSIMPVHWGAFSLAQHSWKEPVEEFIKESNNKNLHYIVPSKGEIIDLNKVYDTKFWWRTID
jgi:L-ascorbate metabolism protein UlaG (beta-lactamase superfamily)